MMFIPNSIIYLSSYYSSTELIKIMLIMLIISFKSKGKSRVDIIFSPSIPFNYSAKHKNSFDSLIFIPNFF